MTSALPTGRINIPPSMTTELPDFTDTINFYEGTKMTDKKTSFAGQVWKTLSVIDVNEHTAKKGGFTYLSWNWAWEILMTHYPESSIVKIKEIKLDDNTVECWVTIKVSDGLNSITRKMWLPVLDYKNKAIALPDASAISNTRMRCMTKCLGLFGLGLYIYQGESLPQALANESLSDEQVAEIEDYIDSTNSNRKAFYKAYGIEHVSDLNVTSYNKALKQFKRKEGTQ